MEDHMGGTHICWIQDNTLDPRKTHSKKMTREASTHGTITLPKHEQQINSRENQNELYQNELYKNQQHEYT